MRRTLLFLTAIVGCFGCQEATELTKRSTETHFPAKVNTDDRMLGALVEHGDQAWSFKLTGPNADVVKLKPELLKFFETVRFVDSEKKPVQWTLPDGWEEDPEPSAGRYATLKTTVPDLFVSVFPLSKGGAEPLPNVNRWRGQMGLPPTCPDYLDEDAKEIVIGGEKGTFVEIVGKAKAGLGMMPQPKLPPPQPPAQAQPKGDEDGKFTYDTPNGWVSIKPTKAFAKVQFKLDDDPQAFATVSIFNGDGGGEATNIKRWRESLKLPSGGEKDIQRVASRSGPAAIVDLVNPQVPGNNRMLGAIITGPGRTAFVKLSGPDGVVGRQKDRFEAFTKSFKFE